MSWGRHYKRQRRRDERAADKRLRTAPLKARLDFVLIGAVSLVVLGFVLAWQFLFSVGERTGVFEPPVIREARDQRVLENFRRDKGMKLVDGAPNRGEARFYVSQTGGLIHSYDPGTRLWRSEDPFAKLSIGRRELVTLRGGCGMDPASSRAGSCADMSSLWALTDGQGLLHRQAGTWREAISATRFTGRSGRNVDGGDLVASAISEDQRWMLLGTRGEGIGLYDLRMGRWVALGAGIQNNMPKGPAHEHIVFWKGSFWIGGGDGLVALNVDGDASIEWRRIQGITGNVRDLAAGERLFVLETRVCDNKAPNCVRISRLDSASSTPSTLMDERNIFRNADLTKLQFAAQQGRMLFLAGNTGLFRYDTHTHAWTKPEDGRFAASLGGADGGTFYVAFQSGAVVEIEDGVAGTKWAVPSQAIVQLFQDEDGTLHALSKAQGIWELSADGSHRKLITPEATKLDPAKFTKLVGRGDNVLLFGPEGGTLHSLSKRTFKDLPRRQLPAWLLRDDVDLITAKDQIFGFVPEGRRFRIFRGDIGQWVAGRVNRFAQGTEWYPGPAGRISPWGADSLSFLDGEGGLWRVQATETERLTGKPLRTNILGDIRDVTQTDGKLLAATGDGLFTYDLKKRRWKQDRAYEIGLGRLKRVAVGPDPEKPFLLSESGELSQLERKTPLIGGGLGFNLTAEQVTDVKRDAIGRFYIGGAGRVSRYDPATRQVDAQWRTGTGAVTILGITDSKPIVVSGGGLYFGNDLVDAKSGLVVSGFVQGLDTWSVRKAGAGLYLKRHARKESGARCIMRHPSSATGNAAILDAREISPGWTAVLTTKGLAFYSRRARSWFPGPELVAPAGTRLAVLGGHLAIFGTTAGKYSIGIAPIMAMREPDSCAGGAIRFTWRMLEGSHMAVDERQGRVVWIDEFGALASWQGGTIQRLLDAPGTGPDPKTLRRIFDRKNHLFFAASDSVWRYDKVRRFWKQIPVSVPPEAGAVTDIVMEPAEDRERLTIRTQAGGTFIAELTGTGRFAGQMRKITLPETGPFTGKPGDILDVQQTEGGLWLFLMTDRLKRFNPKTRKWLPDETLPVQGGDLKLNKVFTRYVITRGGGAEWYAGARDGETRAGPFQKFTPNKGEQVAIDSTGNIWRLGASSRVVRCTPSDGTIDKCAPISPPPIMLDPGKVTAAYTLRTQLIVVEDGRIRAIDPGRFTELAVPADLAALRGVKDVRSHASGLWVLFNNGDLAEIADLSEKDGVRIHRDARAIAIDAEGRLWARLKGSWRRYEVTGFGETPAVPGEKTVFATVEDNGRFVLVTETGMIHVRRGESLRATRKLPGSLDPKTFETVLEGRGGGYWVYANGMLTHLEPSVCADQRDACLRVAGDVPLTARPVQLVDPGGGIALFALADGTSVRVITAGRYATLPDTLPRVTPGTQRNVWSSYRGRVVSLGGNRFAFDPPVTLAAVGKTGSLVVRRPSGVTALGAVGAKDLQPPAPLDMGWMRWDRKTRRFLLRTGEGDLLLSPAEFFPGGRMLPDGIVSVLDRGDGLYAANRHGIWRYPNRSLALDQKGIAVRPVKLTGDVVGAHGRFVTRREAAWIGKPGLRPRIDHLVTVGKAQFSEDVFAGRLTSVLHGANGPVSPFLGRRFSWDYRRGVAFGPDGILVLSDAGLHGLMPESTILSPPAPGAAGEIKEIATPLEGGAFARLGDGTWKQLTAAGWTEAMTPITDTWTAIDTASWKWTFDGGRLQIVDGSAPGAGPSKTWKLVQTGDGVTFARDRLRAATGTEAGILLLTDGASEYWSNPGGEGERRSYGAPVPVDELLAHGGQIYRRENGNLTVWSAGTASFSATGGGNNPFTDRNLALGPHVRFRKAKGAVLSELRVREAGKPEDWKRFAITLRGMPFDDVTDMRLTGPYLYVGTEGGLQIYPAGGVFTLQGASQVGAPEPVSRVFEPAAAPGLVVAVSGAGCTAFAARAPLPCTTAALTGREHLARTPFWTWWRDRNGVRGQYRIGSAFPGIRDGLTETTPIRMTGGRISHDDLRDAALCSGVSATLWTNGIAETGKDPMNSLAISAETRLADLSAIRPQRLLCIADRFRSGGEEIEAGLYALGPGGIARHTGTGWTGVQKATRVAALRDQLRNTAGQEYRFGQIRIAVGSTRATEYAYQDLGGSWHPVPWRNGRLAIDDIARAAAVDGKVWVSTDAGFLSYSRSEDGELRLKSDAVTLIREPRPDGKACPVTDLLNAQGTVVIRCRGRSDQVFTGVLSARKDAGVFTKYSEPDPFAKPVYVSDENAPWKWQAIERVNGTPGRLIFTFKGETNPLSDGRFDFDRITSLAVFEGKKLELAGDVGGWYRGLRDGLPLSVIERPTDIAGVEPKAVAAVGLMRQSGKPLQLCLSAGSVGGVLLAPDGSTNNVAACFEDQGTDGLWRYAKSGRLLVIESAENPRRQTVTRRLREGRFGDDVAGGLPAVTGSVEAIRYQVPTRAGLLTMDENLRRIAIAPWGDQAKPGDAPPSAYHANRGAGALFTRDSRVFDYGAEGSKPTQLPAGGTTAKVLSVGDGPFTLVKVRWRDGDKRGFFMGQMGAKGFGLSMENAFPVDVSQYPSIIQRQRRLPGVDMVITVHVEEDKLVLRDRKKTREVTLGLPHKMKLVNYGMFGTKLVLMDAERIVEVDLNKPAWWLLSKKPSAPKTSSVPLGGPGGATGALPAATAAATAATTGGAAAATAR